MSGSRIPFDDGVGAQAAALERIAAHLDDQLHGLAADALRGVRRPLFTGIGASYAALAAPVALLRRRGVAAQRVVADEIHGDATGFDTDLVVAVSQGGRSTETLAALDGISVPRLGVVNVTPSPLTALADHVLDLGNEPDSYASTVGLTGTVVALERLAAVLTGIATSPWTRIGAQVDATVNAARTTVDAMVEHAATCVAADVVASSTSRTAAESGALLLREVARIPSTASATRTYLHGEMESAGRTLHVVLGDAREVDLARTLAHAGHTTLLVTARDDVHADGLHVITVPDADPAVRAVLGCVALQVVAGTVARDRGLDIEAFVFANDDTKDGGVDASDFAVPSLVPHTRATTGGGA